MSLAEINSLLPLLNIIFAIGVVPLIKTLNNLNNNLEKLCLRLDYIEKDIGSKHERLEAEVKTWSHRLERHIEQHN